MPHPRLDLDASAPSEGEARLADFTWAGPGEDRALFALPGEELLLVRTRREGPVRWVDQFRIEGGEPMHQATLRWDLTDQWFAETGRWVEGSPNQHRRAMALPARMRVGEPVLPNPTARITLAWVGLARLRCGEHPAGLRCARLYIELPGARFDQWLAEGVGELATGPAHGPFGSWLIGWQGGDRRLFGGLGRWAGVELPEGPRPDDEAEIQVGYR